MAGGAASAGLAALALCVVALTACGTGAGGTRDEGAARVGDATPKATVSPSPSPSLKGTRLTQVQAVALVKDDPTVNARVRADLKPCFKDTYPVDVSYGNLTGGSSEDIMVNVMTCGDGIGMGSYVYRAEGRKYQNVFKAEEPPVYAEMNRGDLIVYQQLYDAGDPVALPSSEDVITYRWKDGRFVETDRMHNDYSSAVNGPDAAAAPEEN